MTKMVSATEFKAKCLALIAQMEKDGEPVTITRRGKPVATLTREGDAPRALKPAFGSMKGTVTWAEGVDPTAPVLDEGWKEALGDKWDRVEREARR